MLLFFGPSAIAGENKAVHAWDSWSFDVSNHHPEPGDSVFYRISYTNMTDTPVRVPKNLMEKVVLSPNYCAGDRCNHLDLSNILIGGSKSLTADEVKWISLAPGAALELHGSLQSLFANTCKPVCPKGIYSIHITADYPPIKGLDSNQKLPAFLKESVTISISPRSFVVTTPQALSFVVTKAQDSGSMLEVEATLENQLDFPIWYPPQKPLDIAYECQIRIVFPDGIEKNKTEIAAVMENASHHYYFDENSGSLLKAGQKKNLKFSCLSPLNALLPKGTQFHISVLLQTKTIFRPQQKMMNPHYFSGGLVSSEIEFK